MSQNILDNARLPVPPVQRQFALPEGSHGHAANRPRTKSPETDVREDRAPANSGVEEQVDIGERFVIGCGPCAGKEHARGIVGQILVAIQVQAKLPFPALPDKSDRIAGIGAEIQNAAKNSARSLRRLLLERGWPRFQANASTEDSIVRLLTCQPGGNGV